VAGSSGGSVASGSRLAGRATPRAEVGAEPPASGIPPPVRPRRAWLVCATTAVAGTIAASLLPSPWSIVCGVIAAFGAIGAFVAFVVIVVLEDSAGGR
jgi:hypothetical protein